MRSLTTKRRLFVAYYLGKANGNATEAARMAGYGSPKVTAAKLLSYANVRAEIEKRVAQVALSADEVLARLSDIASVDVADFIDFDPPPLPPPKNLNDAEDRMNDAWEGGGVRLRLDLARRRGKTHLIKSIKAGKYGLSIELHDAQSALEKLAKYHGLLVEKIEHGIAPITPHRIANKDPRFVGGDGKSAVGRDREPDAPG